MPNERVRSPWTGLTSRQSLEIADTLNRPEFRALPADEAAWALHLTYARRAAAALVGNDIRAALDAAELARATLTLWEREPGRDESRLLVLDPPALPAPQMPARLGHIAGG